MMIMPDDIMINALRRSSIILWSSDYSDLLSSLVVVNTNVNKVDEIHYPADHWLEDFPYLFKAMKSFKKHCQSNIFVRKFCYTKSYKVLQRNTVLRILQINYGRLIRGVYKM